MPKVAVIGAGDVGTTIAYTLQVSGLATDIILIDINQKVTRGHVMDMNHGLFFVPPVNLIAGNYSDCRNADVVIITAGARQKPGESRMALLERNASICRSIVDEIIQHTTTAVFLKVTNPVDVMTQVVIKHSSLPRFQVIGSGTVLDSARFRYLLSQHCHVDARNVHAYVIGEHGDSEVILWSQVRIAGTQLKEFTERSTYPGEHIDKELITHSIKDSAYHIIEAKGATNYGVGLAVRRIVEAIIRNENSVLTVSTLLNGEYGFDDVCLSVPCIINKEGIKHIIETKLDRNEEKALEQSAKTIKETYSLLN